MFKKRIKELLLYATLIPSLIAAWCFLCYLLIEYTPLESLFQLLDKYYEYVLGTLLVIILLFVFGSFINWLFIQPYKHYRRSKANHHD